MADEVRPLIAVSIAELSEFGCPYCGYRSGATRMSGGGAAFWVCGECDRGCVGLAEGITLSPIGFVADDGTEYRPELQPHPRRGTPSHGQPDKRPESGGEFFRPRGIGLDSTPGCFVCGGDNNLRNNIAAFVQCKEAGERVVAMFSQGARLDYREREPDYVQVKIGACDQHLPNLEKLQELTYEDGIITAERVSEALG